MVVQIRVARNPRRWRSFCSVRLDWRAPHRFRLARTRSCGSAAVRRKRGRAPVLAAYMNPWFFGRVRSPVHTKRVSRPPVMQGQATRKSEKRENAKTAKNAKTRKRRKRENESKSPLEWSQKSMPEIDLGLEVVVLMLMIREWWLSQRLL